MKEWKTVILFLLVLLMVTPLFSAPVPDTGITKCYNDTTEIPCPSPGEDYYGQDANYTINPMSYTKLDSSGNALSDSATTWAMVRDNVTGLIWEIKTGLDMVKNYTDPHDADNTYTWYDSNPETNGGYAGTPGDGTDTEYFIKQLNDSHFGGYSDWRLPTIKELSYIVNDSIPYPGPTINTEYFPTYWSTYWSSTNYANSDSHYSAAWRVGLNYGTVEIQFKSSDFGWCGEEFVRAVRGGQSGSSYTDNKDGTVTDTSTGLMWQQETPDDTMTWQQALAYCEGLSLGGQTDWRLPTKKELHSLVDYSRDNPPIDTAYFPDTISMWYWSSTTGAQYDYTPGYAWDVSFVYGGYDGSHGKGSYGYVRAVRGGQSGPLDNSVLSVTPSSQNVESGAGSTSFSVSNTGTGTMEWSAQVISGSSWLQISSGANGSNSGTINCSFSENTDTATRTGTIRITASGATGSPKEVTVTQEAGTEPGDCLSDWVSQNPPQGNITDQETSDIDCIFDAIESLFPDLLYPPTDTIISGYMAYRSYTTTGAYLVVWKTDTLKVIYLGPLSEFCPLELGTVNDLKALLCQSPDPGNSAGLWSGSNIQFNVSPDGSKITSTGSSIVNHTGMI